MATKQNFTAIVRETFERSGLSMKRLADLSGAQYQSTHGFFRTRTRTATIETFERWCNVLGLELRPAKKRKGQ